MKYNEIMNVNKNFISSFDLENEEMDQYWRMFIPNDTFRSVLSAVIDSLNTDNQKNPVWLQGTYGTGKTYASLVIKHLLCDEEFSSYELDDNQLTSKLKNFREKTKVFPVIIKGTSTIDGPKRFSVTIQNAVKKALTKNNMNVTISSDFENMVKILEEYPLKKEDVEGTDLEFFDNRDIISKLKDEDVDILMEVERIFIDEKNLAPVDHGNIVDWLTNIKKELKKEYDIDYLMIFWDEFTGALNMVNVEDILLQIQNISEAKNRGLSLLIVSHRTRGSQTNINQEMINKVMDRFELKLYGMEPVATYELMARSIDKKESWKKVKNNYIDDLYSLIDKINVTGEPKVRDALENLYPIHPYTAFLSTFIADEIGSTKRSIFKFLHDDMEYGFRSFIDTSEIGEHNFLTAEYLWDFFYDDFEKRNDEKIVSSIAKYKLKCKQLETMDEEYMAIFKVILLLNILYKIANVNKGSLVIPSEDNIKNVFRSSIHPSKIDNVLNYIDEQDIINKTPDNLFELTTNPIPDKEVEIEIRKLKEKTRLKDMIKSERKVTNKFDRIFRETEVSTFDASINEQKFINDIEKGIFKNSGYVHIIFFICKTKEEYDSINKIIKSVFNKDNDLLNNIIIVVSKAVLDEKEYNRYLQYRARSIVAEKHNYKEDVKSNDRNADGIVEIWINNINRRQVDWYLNDSKPKTSTLDNFTNLVNTELSKTIFNYGLENISRTLDYKNIWPKKVAQKLAEKYQISKNIDELHSKLPQAPEKNSLVILYDNNENLIVNKHLQINEDIPDNHPIKKLQDFIDTKFENAQSKGQFNLGRELKPLTEAPYGLYACIVNIAALSLVLRKYAGRLYNSKGNSIDNVNMRDLIISLFNFWSDGKDENKLLIRFGSVNEKNLGKLLNEIFNLGLNSDDQSINKVRWGLREWIKIKKAPLWLFKYADYMDKTNISTSFNVLYDLLKPDDNNIPDDLIKNCYTTIKSTKTDLILCIEEDRNILIKKFLLTINETLTQEDIDKITSDIDNTFPEEIYDWKEEDIKFRVMDWLSNRDKKHKPNLLIDSDNRNISVSLDKEATGEIVLSVGGMKFYEKIDNGIANFNLSNLEGDKTYTVIVSYEGDEKFLEEQETFDLEIKRENPNMNFYIKGNIIEVSLNKNATGKILVDIDNSFHRLENGFVKIELTNLEGGKKYKGNIIYDGDNNFSKDKQVVELIAERENPNMDVSFEENIIYINIDKNVTGNIIVETDNKQYHKKINEGHTEISLSDLDEGKTYEVMVSYEGNDRFYDVKSVVNIKINKRISIETIEKSNANLVKEAIIKALKNNEKITLESIIKYLESFDSGD